MKLKRILVPTDFSDFSRHALDEAIEVGKTFRAEIVLLHVLEPIYFATSSDVYGYSANLAMLMEELRQSARRELERLGRAVGKRGLRVQTALASGAPHALIVDAANKRRADLIVISTHGRSGLSHMLMGSVAEKVLRGASCPVLIVRPQRRARRRAARKPRKRA
jgi:nucleotide-binding universal stress UspA family protein